MIAWNIICYVAIIVFLMWLAYIQIAGWRRTKGFRMTMEMSLVDRFHDEVIYQLCYKRGYKVDLDMDDDAYWVIKKTNHPNKKRVKMIVFWATIQTLFRPYGFRTGRLDDFDDFDPKWGLEE